ncbi:MAG: hypothetical protein N2201_03920, partial [candidate division WOR-3 bacterium]|nr:hypothetical protein [candidate division WOR-3 bacterium]
MKGVIIIIMLFIISLSAQQVEVIIGTDTTSSYAGPINRFYNYSGHEAIYLQSEIGHSGNITHIAYYKQRGDNIDPIENVTVYMKHTADTSLATTLLSSVGFSIVFNGAFPNNSTNGWMEIALTTPFLYNNTDNLQVLILKGYQPYIPVPLCPYYRYTSTSPVYRCRQGGLDALPYLIQTFNRPNIKLTIVPSISLTENNFTNLIETEVKANPNPAINKTNISFNLSEAQKVSLKIYDTKGKL